MRLSALIDEFVVDCRSRRLSPKTVSWYQANLGYFLDWLLAHDGADTLQAFTLTNARRYSQELAERMARHGTFVGGAPRRGVYALVESDQRLRVHTITGYLRTLKTFSRWLAAEEQGYTSRDVLAGLKLPKQPQTHQEPLKPDEMGQVLAGYDLRHPIGMRDFAIVLTYLGTGLRATELTNLLLDDVHLDDGYLRVRAGKGNKTRAVNLPPEVTHAILRYRQHYRPDTDDPHLFVTRSGTTLSYNAIRLVLRRARQRSGIERLHAHLLRHSFSVSALTNGMDLMTLKETLGHSDIRTTARYLAMAEQQIIEQQRKVNPLDNVTLPKAIRRKTGG